MSTLERWHDIRDLPNHKSIREAANWLIRNFMPRYVPWYDVVMGKRIKRTACNIFVTDMIQQLHLPGPYHWCDTKGNPMRWGYGVQVKGRELSANAMIEWLAKNGHGYGWTRVNEEEALKYAKDGKFVMVTWHSGSPKPGHVAVLLEDGSIAQAGGGMPFVGQPIVYGFGRQPVGYWAYVEPVKPQGSGE